MVYDMKQQANLQISVVQTGNTITIKAENTAGKPYTVRLINVQAVSLDGASMVIDGKDTVLTPSDSTVSVTL